MAATAALNPSPLPRVLVALLGAVVVALGLFLGMQLMITASEYQVDKTDSLCGVDFIRLKREHAIRVKKRQ